MITCDYCGQSINDSIESVVTTSIKDEVLEVTHRKCWLAMNKIVEDILQYSPGGYRFSPTLLDGVDNESQVR